MMCPRCRSSQTSRRGRRTGGPPTRRRRRWSRRARSSEPRPCAANTPGVADSINTSAVAASRRSRSRPSSLSRSAVTERLLRAQTAHGSDVSDPGSSPANGPRVRAGLPGWFDRDHVRAKVRKDHPRDHALVVGQVDDPVVLQHRFAPPHAARSPRTLPRWCASYEAEWMMARPGGTRHRAVRPA